MTFNKLIYISIVIVTLLPSCREDKTNLIEVYHYKIFTEDSEEISDTLYLTKEIKEFNNSTYEIYSEPGEDSIFNYAVNPLSDFKERILFFNDTCELVKSKTFRLDGKEIEVNKYNLDRKNSEDEESYIYYNSEIGLIAIYNYSWFTMDFFDQKSSKGLLEMFKSDTTGFIR